MPWECTAQATLTGTAGCLAALALWQRRLPGAIHAWAQLGLRGPRVPRSLSASLSEPATPPQPARNWRTAS
jgi:hypothetical protein